MKPLFDVPTSTSNPRRASNSVKNSALSSLLLRSARIPNVRYSVADDLYGRTMHRRALLGEGLLELDRLATTMLERGWEGYGDGESRAGTPASARSQRVRSRVPEA